VHQKFRARKYAKKFSSKMNSELPTRIAAEMWEEEKEYLNTA